MQSSNAPFGSTSETHKDVVGKCWRELLKSSVQQLDLTHTHSLSHRTMGIWSLILLSISFPALIHLSMFYMKKRKLPPGPPAIPILGNLLWLGRPFGELEPSFMHGLFKKHGPIVTLYIGSRPFIFIGSGAVAHKALVEQGAVFSDRPTPPAATAFISSNQHDVTSGAYGPLWVFLRRNIASETLHPSAVKRFAGSRQRALGTLVRRLRELSLSSADGAVVARDSFQFALFSLVVPMCFGRTLGEGRVREIKAAQRNALLHGPKLIVFSVFPALVSRFVFSGRLKTSVELRRKQKELILPLIEARRGQSTRDSTVSSYLDSILDIEIPGEGGRSRRLTDDEIVTLCSDFLDASTDTSWTVLEWIMAEIVRSPRIQGRLVEEIERVTGGEGAVGEEEVGRMPYVKAVVMEGMRRHPPSYTVIPHAVTTREAELEGHVIPKGAPINFMVAEIGRDEGEWVEPMEFRPERFVEGEGRGVDITGSREVKMMPFGVGRRICPGLGLAMLHLEYLVANLVREFEWRAAEGEEVDMSEVLEFLTVMKHPLRARLIPRRNR